MVLLKETKGKKLVPWYEIKKSFFINKEFLEQIDEEFIETTIMRLLSFSQFT